MPSEAVATVATWRLWLDLAGRPGWENMALDQAMLDRAGRGETWLRLYRWAPHCLSFGRHEPALRRYDRARIESLGLDVVRRPTGGRAVWHAEELTYAIAAPADELGGLRQAYHEIHAMLLDGFVRLGIAGELAPAGRPVGPAAGACFASPAGGEIMVGGRKAVGSAQLREGAGLLQHGSILLAGRQDVVHAVTRGECPPDLAGSLTEYTGTDLDPGRVAEAVAAAAVDRWDGEWMRPDDCAGLLTEAAAYEARFRSPEWTWRA